MCTNANFKVDKSLIRKGTVEQVYVWTFYVLFWVAKTLNINSEHWKEK